MTDYRDVGADSYDPYLTDGETIQTSVGIECSVAGAGTYNYFKPAWLNDTTNYDIVLVAGKPIPRVIPKGSTIYSGSIGSTTALTAGLIWLTYINEL